MPSSHSNAFIPLFIDRAIKHTVQFTGTKIDKAINKRYRRWEMEKQSVRKSGGD